MKEKKQPGPAIKNRFVPGAQQKTVTPAGNAVPRTSTIVYRMKLTGIDVPFSNLVWLLVQLAVATIPAGIIVGIIYMFLGSIFGRFVP